MMPNNDIMVSIRNYDQVVIIRDEKILSGLKMLQEFMTHQMLSLRKMNRFFITQSGLGHNTLLDANFENPAAEHR